MIQNILLQMGLPALVRTVTETLKQHPDKTIQNIAKDLQTTVEKSQDTHSISQNDVDTMVQKGIAQLDPKTLASINTTIRKEVASNDAFVRRMRPTFGYVLAITWGVQMTAIAVAMFVHPDKVSGMISAFGELGMMWTIGLSVLGVYVYKRSGEKSQMQ